jgi:hypothetical protein
VKGDRRERDSYPTPLSVVDAMLDRLDWRHEIVWEPCAGDGRMVDALAKRGVTVIGHDIETGRDFFDWQTAQATTLITNPPFKMIRQFVDHAFAIGVERMALVCNERLWACGKGHDQWSRHRPSRFANLTWREDYLGKGGSPDRALAISVWDTPHADECRYEVWERGG